MILHIYCADTVTVFENLLFDEFEQLKGCFPFSNHIESPILISIGSIYHAAILDLIKYNKEQQIINTIEDVLK